MKLSEKPTNRGSENLSLMRIAEIIEEHYLLGGESITEIEISNGQVKIGIRYDKQTIRNSTIGNAFL